MAVSVVQNPPLATEGKEVTLTASVDDSDVSSPVTWSEVHGIRGESSGTFGQTYTISDAQRGAIYRAEVGSESADFELRVLSEVKAEAELDPMFSPRQLAFAAGALLIAAAVAMVLPAILTFSLWESVGSENRLGVAMSLLMFGAGLVVVLGALWLLVANLRKPKAILPMGGVTDATTAGAGATAADGRMVEKQGSVLKEKAPGAMVLVGVVLMLMAGFFASEAVGETSSIADTSSGSCAYVLVLRRGSDETRITVPSGERPVLDSRGITIEDC